MVNDRNNQISPIKTVIAVLLPLFELGLGSFFIERVHGQVLKATISSGFSLIAFLIAIYLFKDLLVSEWHGYRKHIWRNLGLSLIGTILCFVILSGVRMLMSSMNLAAPANGVDVLSIQTIQTQAVGLYATIPVLLAPWTEELVFRHAIFYQFKSKGKLIFWTLFIVQAVLFGLVHWFNFNGHVIQTIPYMAVGAWFGLIYVWGKNIWFNIFSHFFFDVITPLAALALLVVTLITQ